MNVDTDTKVHHQRSPGRSKASVSANLNAPARSPPSMDGCGCGTADELGHGHDALSPPLSGYCALSAVCDVTSTMVTFNRDTQDVSLWCSTESLLDPKLLEMLRLDASYLIPFSPTPMPYPPEST